jgi:hypothetical protein
MIFLVFAFTVDAFLGIIEDYAEKGVAFSPTDMSRFVVLSRFTLTKRRVANELALKQGQRCHLLVGYSSSKSRAVSVS